MKTSSNSEKQVRISNQYITSVVIRFLQQVSNIYFKNQPYHHMPDAANKNKLTFIQQNISYYNEVAESYDAIMDQDRNNEFVRRRMRDKFISVVNPGTVLDFGGGTGLDLEWLTTAGYKIYFCEPSPAMREQAIKYNNNILHNPNLVFIETAKTDFTRWYVERPFYEKMDAILSNFGVINYIPHLDSLFDALAGVIKPGGHFMAIILSLNFRKRLQWHRRNAIQALLFGRSFKMYIPFKNQHQTVFVHTPAEIKKASGNYFDCCKSEYLKPLEFTLIHLVRNENTYKEMVNG